MTTPRLPHRRDRRDGLRIYTHNIFARRADWPARRRVLRDGLAALDPDVVLFQEEVWTDDADQTRDLVGEDVHVVHSAGRSSEERSGISVASRWPVTAVHEIDLTAGGPPVDEFVWAALVVTVQAPPPLGPVVVVNHFPDASADGEHERERQAVLVARAVEEIAGPDDLPVVLGGDLDAEPDAASLRFLRGRQSLDGTSVAYVRAWDAVHPGTPCPTLDESNGLVAAGMRGWPFREIDHLLVRCGRSGLPPLLVQACERVHDRAVDGVWASDHYGLVADLVPRG